MANNLENRGAHQPPVHTYNIRIDDEHFKTQKQELTGAEILELAGKTVAGYTLRLRLRGGKIETVSPEQIVKLDEPGLERFITIPKENSEGERVQGPSQSNYPSSPLRRDFMLCETDTTFLDANHSNWEAVMDNGVPYVVLNNFPVPAGYNHSRVRAAIILTSGYPLAALDMVYFSPALSRIDGRSMNALAPHSICGEVWQRWSRHYNWRHGVDDLTIHVERIRSWLDDELLK